MMMKYCCAYTGKKWKVIHTSQSLTLPFYLEEHAILEVNLRNDYDRVPDVDGKIRNKLILWTTIKEIMLEREMVL